MESSGRCTVLKFQDHGLMFVKNCHPRCMYRIVNCLIKIFNEFSTLKATWRYRQGEITWYKLMACFVL
jgi:hypothetical protein